MKHNVQQSTNLIKICGGVISKLIFYFPLVPLQNYLGNISNFLQTVSDGPASSTDQLALVVLKARVA